jgi:hypothetical protein
MRRLLTTVILILLVAAAASARVFPVHPLTPLAKLPIPCVPGSGGSLDEHPNIRINSDHTTEIQNEEMACISPLDAQNFVAVWRDFRLGYRRVAAGYSTDAGQSWTDALFPASYYPWQSDPVLVVNAEGVFTAMVVSFDPAYGGEDGLLQITSTDGGVTWRDSVWAINATQPLGFEDKEMLTVDVSSSPYHGTHYCTWAHFYQNPQYQYDSTHIWLVYQRPGEAYSTPHVLSQNHDNQWPNVCVGPNGEVYVSWVCYPLAALMFSWSSDGGQTWTPEAQITPTNVQAGYVNPELLVFSYGVMAADLSNGPHRGRLYVVYMDADSSFTDTDIWFRYSDDHGDHWSAGQRMNDDSTDYPVDHFHPWISVDEEGKVWVVFYDRRNDPNGLLMDVYFTVSTDGGQTWRANERITTVSSDPAAGTLDAGLIGEYIGWQARGGNVLCVWTDTRLGNQDAFGSLIDSTFAGSEDRGFIFHPSSFSISTLPNPFNSSTTIAYDLPKVAHISLRVFDLLGREVAALKEGFVEAGTHRVTFDGSHLASGIYFARLDAGSFSQTKKLMLMR